MNETNFSLIFTKNLREKPDYSSLKANVSEEILNGHSLRHSYSAEICIHSYCLS